MKFFRNFNFFNNTSEPLYEIFDKQCNSIGFYEINEYTEILETNKEYLVKCKNKRQWLLNLNLKLFQYSF